MSKRGGQNFSWSRRNNTQNRKFQRTKFDTGLSVQFRRRQQYNVDNNQNNWRDDGERNYAPRGRRGNLRFNTRRGDRRFVKNHHHQTHQPHDPDNDWFKVTIPHGHRVDKKVLLQKLQSELTTPFSPYNFHEERGSCVFQVVGENVAEALRSISRRISVPPDGNKLLILVNRGAQPQTQINDEFVETLKNVMSSRYNTMMKVLDLSKFREDDTLRNLGLFVPLNRSGMLKLVIKIITQHIPDLVGLNLSHNKIVTLESLTSLANVCNSLQAIDLSMNSVNNASELNHISKIDLSEVILEGNPVCESFEDQAAYINYIRTKFPKLTKLDGEVLPAQIGFEVAETSNLPQSQPSYLPDEIKQFTLQFFEAFYNFYDTDRQQLIQAYHDQACFSMSLARSDSRAYLFPEGLISESRNLLRVKDYSNRCSLLKQGKVNIVAALDTLPKTKHEPDSFIIDIPFYNQSFVVVVVNGVYRELLKKQSPLRAFCRTFFIVPQGSGFVIINDMLLLVSATVSQIQKYGKNAASNSAANSLDRMMTENEIKSETVSTSNNITITRSITNNNSLIESFMNATGMNRIYAQQCLEEYNFDFNAAIKVFEQLKNSNAIPTEAFT